jgi:hypothetical protein
VFVPGKSPVKVQPEILDIFFGELYIVYVDREARFTSYVECNMGQLGSVSFCS